MQKMPGYTLIAAFKVYRIGVFCYTVSVGIESLRSPDGLPFIPALLLRCKNEILRSWAEVYGNLIQAGEI